MPKRTNEYQKLVLAISKHFASRTAKVTESAMLYDDSTEQNREIDILIEDEIGGFKIRVGVECTAVNRPLTVAKLEEIIAKHKDCGVHKTIIVSKSGFASTTQVKAAKVGIELINYEAALQKDWPAEFDLLAGIEPYHVRCELKSSFAITVSEESSLNDFDLTVDPLVVGHNMTLSEYLMKILAEKTVGLMLPPYLNAEKATTDGVEFSQSWVFQNGIVIKDKSGRTVEVIAAQPEFIYQRKALFGDRQAGRYNGKLVCSSVTNSDNSFFKESRFTVSKNDDGDSHGGISVSLSLDI